jgi:hypothetical protein
MSVDTKDQLALHQARQSQLNNSSVYIERFLGQTDPAKDYEQSACPVCLQDADQALFSKNNGEYCYCPDCKHIYLSNPLKEEQLIRFYTGYPTSSLEWHHNESDFYRQIYQKGIDMVKPFCKGSNMLDIGCSGGYFLSIASKQGFKTSGVEPNREESGYAANHGIKIVGSTISDLDNNSKYESLLIISSNSDHISMQAD